MLHIVLSLQRKSDVIVLLEVDEALQTIPLGESSNLTVAMLSNPTDNVIRHANVQRAVWTIGQDIDPAPFHAPEFASVDGRDKPGHDGCEA